MSEQPQSNRRPFAIPIRVFLILLAGLGIIASSMRIAIIQGEGNIPFLLRIVGGLVCLWGLYEGSRSLRFGNLVRPVRRSWGNREVAVTREGLVYLVILMSTFVAAFLGKSNLLLLVFSFLAATFVLNGAVTNIILDRNRVRRVLPDSVVAGESLAVELLLFNQRRWLASWLVILQDQISNSREILQPRVLFRRVPPRGQSSIWYQIRFGQRGIYHFGPLKLVTRFPLGFVERAALIDEPDTIIVHPRIGILTSTWRNESADAEDLMRHRRARPGTHDDDFHRLREYRVGDNPKSIHWLTSARKNELMIREYHETRDRDLIVLLDLQAETPPGEYNQTVEQAVSFVATLCVDHCRRNRGAGLILGLAGNREFYWRGASGPNAIPHLLNELAQLDHARTPNLQGILAQAAEVRWGKCHRILVTTQDVNRVNAMLDQSHHSGHFDLRQQFRVIQASPERLARLIHWE